jgi:1,4-alpha-glucan branching enzyme
MLEAMFNGLPVIGSDTNGINDIIIHGENGLLFQVNNIHDLKNKIIYIIENKEVSERITHKAEENHKKNYQFEKVVNQYLELYKTFRQIS